jgi:hypothetical protein
MTTIQDISQERVRALFCYDPFTGILTRRVSVSQNAKAGDMAGSLTARGYRSVRVDGRQYLEHRIAWLYMTGAWPDYIDHMNGIKNDNRLINLRNCSIAVNTQNQRMPKKKNKSGYLGVSFHKAWRKWRAQIRINGSKVSLGGFDTPQLASIAYIEAKRKFHPGCTI